MRDLHGRVYRILSENESARGSDNILYLEVVKDYGYLRTMSLVMMAGLVTSKALPSIETVGRVRRKVQELHPDLMPNKDVVAYRELKEKQFEEYARRVY